MMIDKRAKPTAQQMLHQRLPTSQVLVGPHGNRRAFVTTSLTTATLGHVRTNKSPLCEIMDFPGCKPVKWNVHEFERHHLIPWIAGFTDHVICARFGRLNCKCARPIHHIDRAAHIAHKILLLCIGIQGHFASLFVFFLLLVVILHHQSVWNKKQPSMKSNRIYINTCITMYISQIIIHATNGKLQKIVQK